MLKLAILIGCFVGIAFAKCSSGGSGGGSSSCGGSSSSVETRSYNDYDFDIIPLPESAGTIGIMDSPFYDCSTKSLYFVDLFKQNIYRYSEKREEVYYCAIPGVNTPSFLIPIKGTDNRFVLGDNQTVYEVEWDGRSSKCNLVSIIVTAPESSTHHTNAAVAGPNGVLFFGFFANNLCAAKANQGLYSWHKKQGFKRLPGSYVTSNSMTYDSKRGILYVMDGCKQTIRAFKVDKKTGDVSEPWIVISGFGLPNSVAPVGLTVDKKGNLVTGAYKGGLVIFINSRTGEITKKVKMPTKYTAAVTYGGCNFDKLYVLTAQLDADITTGTPTNNTVAPPGGSLLVFDELGRGQGQLRKPCVGC